MPRSQRSSLAINLIRALLAGAWSKRAISGRVRDSCDADRRVLARLVADVWSRHPSQAPTIRELVPLVVPFLDRLTGAVIRRVFILKPTMTPRWPVPVLTTLARVADWLETPLEKLLWYADRTGTTTKQPSEKLRHYVSRWIPRRRGKPRLLEAPKPTLKMIQRRILAEILDHVPPHDAAHGFRPGRSTRTYVAPHVARPFVLRFDVRDFFPSISAAHVTAIFRTIGYPAPIARLLYALCTTRTPSEILDDPRWRSPHLPQGAPTSPALANLAAYRLDVRLTALAQSLGASYTRYADDLAFSGDTHFARQSRRLQVLVATIALEEGLQLHLRKTRFMRRSVCAQPLLFAFRFYPLTNSTSF